MNYEENKKEFIKLFKSINYKYDRYSLFSDFCKISAISLNQAINFTDEKEEEYLYTIKKYDKSTINIFPNLLSYLVMAFENSFGDFLGEVYMDIGISSKEKGQFFTPYYISKFMSSILADDKNSESRIMKFLEPACGAGGMIIAKADVLKSKGINYQKVLEVQAIDISEICFYMTYIQLTLLNIKAEVINGNSLTLKYNKSWITPAYYLNNYYIKDKKIEIKEEKKEIILINNDKYVYTQEQLNTFANGTLF